MKTQILPNQILLLSTGGLMTLPVLVQPPLDNGGLSKQQVLMELHRPPWNPLTFSEVCLTSWTTEHSANPEERVHSSLIPVQSVLLLSRNAVPAADLWPWVDSCMWPGAVKAQVKLHPKCFSSQPCPGGTFHFIGHGALRPCSRIPGMYGLWGKLTTGCAGGATRPAREGTSLVFDPLLGDNSKIPVYMRVKSSWVTISEAFDVSLSLADK